jgi:hypothetical protein
MRFGISATSSILPKNFRMRLRPVNVCAIRLSLFYAGTPAAHGDSPNSRNPSRPLRQALELASFSISSSLARTTGPNRRTLETLRAAGAAHLIFEF